MNGKIKFGLFTFIMLMVLTMSSCNGNEPTDISKSKESQERIDIQLDDKTRAVADNLKDFYVRFTKDMVESVDQDAGIEDKNVIVSPLGASIILGMISDGVDETAQNAVNSYLGTNDTQALNQLMSTLLVELPKMDNAATLTLNNMFAVNTPLRLTSGYENVIKQFYNASIYYEDFNANNKKALDYINDWCFKNSDGMIGNYLKNLEPDIYGIALNALSFKGQWTNGNGFDKGLTTKSMFHGINGDHSVDMMHGEIKASVSLDENFSCLSLPFGNGAFNLYLLLPHEGISANNAMNKLTPERLKTLLSTCSSSKVELYLPKFNLNTEYNLNKMYSRVGLSALVERTPHISIFEGVDDATIIFRQGNSFSIDETGAKGAAISSAEFTFGSVSVPQTIKLTFNRPFLFFLNETSTGACLLSGRVANL